MLIMKTEKKTMFLTVKLIGFLGLAILVTGFLIAARPAGQEAGVEMCADCHDDIAKAFMNKPHSATKSCLGCHGDADKHLEEGGGLTIFAFKSTDIPNTKNKKCLVCHSKSNSAFMASPHGKSAMDCTSCHVMHSEETKPSLLKAGATKGCIMCHEDVFSKFHLNERHRLQEGILGCTTCHDPHAPALRERLGGFKHQACLKCHTDKGGPFLYEHLSSRIEGCSTCHEVHGSPNRHMLKQHSISDLCFSCHTTGPSWHAYFSSSSTNCTTCHPTIHGSNLSRLFLK